MRKALIIILVLVVVGVVAADRLGVLVAQDEIAKQVAAQYNLQQKPAVTIKGFPFITQAIGGSYDEIDVRIGDWTQQPQNVTVHDLNIKVTGLRAPLGDVVNRNTSNLAAGSATAEAVIPFDVLKQYAPRDVDSISASGGDLQLHGTFRRTGFISISVPGAVVVAVKATTHGIQVTPQSIKPDSGPTIPVGLLSGGLSFVVPVQNLPIGSHISEVTVTPTGLKVAATATDVHFNNLPRT